MPKMLLTQLIIIVTCPKHGALHMTAVDPGGGGMFGPVPVPLIPIAFRHPFSTCHMQRLAQKISLSHTALHVVVQAE